MYVCVHMCGGYIPRQKWFCAQIFQDTWNLAKSFLPCKDLVEMNMSTNFQVFVILTPPPRNSSGKGGGAEPAKWSAQSGLKLCKHKEDVI